MQSSGQASFPIIENGLLFKVEHMHTGSHVNLLLLDKQNEHFCCILQGQTQRTKFFFEKPGRSSASQLRKKRNLYVQEGPKYRTKDQV